MLAHISAAEPNGPRYDVTKDDEFRRSYDNLFFLCNNCHTLIDKPELVHNYPTNLLIEMKSQHEEAHSSKPIDVSEELVDQVVEQMYISQGNILGSGTQYNVQQNIFGDLAASAHKTANDLAAMPAEPPSQTEDGNDEEEDEEGGVLDKIAEVEVTLPLWNQTIDEMAAEIRKIGPIFEAGTAQIKKSDSLNKGISGRLAIFKGIAKNLNEPASKIEALGKRYIEQFNLVEPGLLAVLDLAEGSKDNPDEDYTDFLENILGLAESGGEGLTSVAGMIDNMHSVSSMSKDMRKVLKKVRNGLDAVLESKPRMETWAKRIRELVD